MKTRKITKKEPELVYHTDEKLRVDSVDANRAYFCAMMKLQEDIGAALPADPFLDPCKQVKIIQELKSGKP